VFYFVCANLFHPLHLPSPVHFTSTHYTQPAMHLHIFGHIAPLGLISPSRATCDTNPTSSCILRAKAIIVLWSSWCDAIFAYQDDDDTWMVEYRGMSLGSVVKEHVVHSGIVRKAVQQQCERVQFFGTEMHDGVRGYVVYDEVGANSQVVVFATEVEEEAGVEAVQSYCVEGGWKVVGVWMGSDGGVMVGLVGREDGKEKVVRFDGIDGLRKWLGSGCVAEMNSEVVASFRPVQWCANSTTTTVLDESGQAHTATRDPRYPRCLGRPFTDTACFEPVPYLSETRVIKVASGGYMSAAVSADGELFLWGQANPGCDTVLSGLKDKVAPSVDGVEMATTRIVVEDEQDDMIKCLNVMIEGEEGSIYDVAIGHGHILVAAEVKTARSTTKRAVFSAGTNSTGQTGLVSKVEFIEDFTEILALKTIKVEQLVATAWTTFVVAAED
jgi:hypothetical protein